MTDPTPPDPLELWRQAAGETDIAYGAFLIYRDLPANERSAARVASEYGRHVRLIERWRMRWHWVDRARSYVHYQDREHRRSLAAERAKMAERQAAEAQAIQAVLFAPVRALVVKLADMIDREELSGLSIGELYGLSMASARLWPAVARSEREARGAPLPEYQPPSDEGGETDAAGLVLTEDFLADVHYALEQANLRPAAPLELPAGDTPAEPVPDE